MAMTPTQQKVYDDATAAAKTAAGAIGGTYDPGPGFTPGPVKPTADPVISNSSVRRYTGTDAPTAYDSAASTYFANTDKSQPDPAAIRQNMLDNVQNQIDQIKNTYTGIIANANQTGANNLGRTRSIDARSGTLGSDFGAADLKKTQENNDQNIKAIEAERDLKISGILSKVNTDAEAKVETEKNRAAKNSEDYLSYLKTSQDAARQNALGLAKAGMTVDKLTDDEYNKLIQTTGFTPQELKDYMVLNHPDDKVLASGTIGNQYYSVTQDPVTGEKKTDTVKLPFTVPEGYTTQKLDDGTVLFVPSKIDPTKSLDSQVLSYGVHAKPVVPKVTTVKPFVSGKLTVTSDDLSQGAQLLNDSKGDDGYVDPAIYQQMYKQWTDRGGLGNDFTKKYPPKTYVNPENRTLPKYLQSATGKAPTTTRSATPGA